MRYPYSLRGIITFNFSPWNLSQGRVAETLDLRHSMANINLYQSQKERFFCAISLFFSYYILYDIQKFCDLENIR